MASIISQFGTDREKELKGVWLPAGSGIELLIARHGNPDFRDYVRRGGKDLQADVRFGNDEAVRPKLEELTRRGVAHHILLGWKNVQEVDGGPDVPYSPEKAVEFFTKMPDFLELVLELSKDRQNFAANDQKESLGNSKAASSGS